MYMMKKRRRDWILTRTISPALSPKDGGERKGFCHGNTDYFSQTNVRIALIYKVLICHEGTFDKMSFYAKIPRQDRYDRLLKKEDGTSSFSAKQIMAIEAFVGTKYSPSQKYREGIQIR